MFENKFVRQLRIHGADGVASYTVVSSEKMMDKATILDQVRRLNADSVLMTKMIAREDAIKHTAPQHQDLLSQYVRSYNYTWNRGYIL